MSKKKISKKTKNTKTPSKKPMSKNCKKSCKKSCEDVKKDCSYREKICGEPQVVSPSSSSFEPPQESSINLWGKIKKFMGL